MGVGRHELELRGGQVEVEISSKCWSSSVEQPNAGEGRRGLLTSSFDNLRGAEQSIPIECSQSGDLQDETEFVGPNFVCLCYPPPEPVR